MACAQTDEVDEDFQVLSSAKAEALRATMSAPVPAGLSGQALMQFVWERVAAARLVGDVNRHEQLLREGMAQFSDPNFKHNLGHLLNRLGRYDEGVGLIRQAIADGNRVEAAFATSMLVCDYFHLNKDQDARQMARETDRRIAAAAPREVTGKIKLLRAASKRDRCMSLVEERLGHYPQAIEFAKSAEQWARATLPLYAQAANATVRTSTLSDVVSAIERKLNAYTAADRLQDAEMTLREYIQFSNEYQLETRYQAVLNASGASLRYAQREFARAQQFAQKTDDILAGMGLEPASRQRMGALREVVAALVGQQKWNDALVALNKVDALSKDTPFFKQRMHFALNRGLIYLHQQRYTDAARVFESAADFARKTYGDTHFFAAQNTGLLGVALWQSNMPDNKARAYALLKTAVRDYMAPANAGFGEFIGIRKEVRTLVFDTYLDAASRTSADDAIAALGPADWARGGVVNDAINDAAVRSAARTPAMADLVRREQDAKNEISGLRRYLAGDIGGSESALPQVAAQMRERIATLEQERAALQAEVKAKFPDYDRLVRPGAPAARDIARQLHADQALVLLLPAKDAVYVWAVASDRPAQFVRANLQSGALSSMVKTLRNQLDFGASADSGKRFDSNIAYALYSQLLAPLDGVLKGKSQLVVAAGGALSQLPFALLQTEAGAGFESTAPWLIKRSSVTQVPSLSGWLAIKSLSSGKAATEAFAGWGDPVFDAKALAASSPAPLAADRTRSLVLTRARTASDNGSDALAQPSIQYARIPTLPDTRDELLAIASTLKSNPGTDLMLGGQATRDSVLKASADGLLAKKRVIAFATHGLMAGDLPGLNQPALALAATGNEEQDPLSPLLTLEDVLTLKLNADWVVLSACNSAAEDGRGDEAMSGLARGFFYAGSRALLVTHWAVESESAKLLTTATFAHYAANPKAPKAESLRQAMLEVMAKPQFQHPAFWAPYALVGDGGR